MIPTVVRTVMTAQRTRPTVTAASHTARKRECPVQRSASAGGVPGVVEREDKGPASFRRRGGAGFASPPEELGEGRLVGLLVLGQGGS